MLKYNVVQTGATLNIQSLDMVMANIVLKSRSERLIKKCLVESRYLMTEHKVGITRVPLETV